MRPMQTAPRDGSEILVLGPHGWRRAYYLCCRWLRDGGDDVPDAWRPANSARQGDIELDEARGWKPARKQ